ncbi:MAG: hypothetical protein E7356_00500 [Clostridiales bacterium]|nr:hypothetical protein [Clostridiales bacterium]
MDKKIVELEKQYLSETLDIVHDKLNILEDSSNNLEGVFRKDNAEYFEYLKRNANKINEEDVVELVNYQTRLEDLQKDSVNYERDKLTYNKMLDKPYFASIDISSTDNAAPEKYYIGIHSLTKGENDYKVVDWRSPIASIFYDYESGECKISNNSSVLNCYLNNKRQYGIDKGQFQYYIDTTVNIEDQILQEALSNSVDNKMKTIIETIQKEQNEIIRGEENKTIIVQGVAGSGKTAIALHRIAYLLYKMKGKINSSNIMFISPNSAFSSYISSVLPELAEDDVEKLQLDDYARKILRKHLIIERRYEQVERLLTGDDLDDYRYKTSGRFLDDLLAYANANYINNFAIDNLTINNVEIDTKKIRDLFYNKYSDRDLFTRFRWIAENIFDTYFYKYKKTETQIKLKQLIFSKLYASINNKNCVKAYMDFLESKGLTLKLVGDKVRNEDAYGILFFKMFVYGLDKFSNVKHLLIDEMQDYSPLQMYILNYLFDCPKTILGDYNQSIDINLAKANFHDFANVLSGDIQILTLGKSYRSTMQIADFYNSIGNRDKANVVTRSGSDVEFDCIKKGCIGGTLINLIKQYTASGYNSIGIITKNNEESRRIHSELSHDLPMCNLIDDNSDSYDNKICVISAFNSKGLEFDAVIIIDSNELYKSEIDRNILYVAASRALHRLMILSVDEESKFIKEFKEKL